MRTVPPDLIPVTKEAEIPHQELDMQNATPINEMTPKFRLISWVYPISANLAASASILPDPFSQSEGETLGFFCISLSLIVPVVTGLAARWESCRGWCKGNVR